MWFTRVSIANPVFATMMMAALLVLGAFSYSRLPVEQFPDVTFPVVVVQTEYPGASPENVEEEVTRRVEEAVNTISGIKTLSSRSYEGLSVVIIEFELSIDAKLAAQDVREKIALIRSSFRDEIKEPRVSRFNPDDFPIASVAVQSRGRSLRELTTLADQVIKKRLENVGGVGQATLVGGVKREIKIYLNLEAMEAQRVGADQVVRALGTENQEIPAGSIVTPSQEKIVQLRARLSGPQDFRNLIVARRGGKAVTLGSVADIEDGQQEEENAALINGQRALSIDIIKAQGENTIAVVDGVRRVVGELQGFLPADVKIEIVRDASTGIRNSVADVKTTLLEGGLLTIAIVFLFLASWRSTVITGLTLPIALIGTFLFLYAFGFTLNVLTLMALSLSVGLLIDDAIVVRENIVRHVALGANHHDAALEGTREIGLAVLATTFSIVAVFLPVGFMGGIIGRFFHQFGLTVVAAVLISMFVSFTLDPMLSSIWRDPQAEGRYSSGPVGRLLGWFHAFMGRIAQAYERLLGWALAHRKTVVAIALLSFLASFPLMKLVGSEFVPEPDLSELQVQFKTPVGASLELTTLKARQAEAALREFPEVKYTYATVNTGFVLGKHRVNIFVQLVPRGDRKHSQEELTRPMRERLARIAGIELQQVGAYKTVSSGKPLQVSILGQERKVLTEIAGQVLAIARATPGVVDLESSDEAARPQIAVELKRELASDLGIGVGQVAATLRPLLAGEAVGNWKGPDDQYYDVRVRLSRADRARPEDLARVPLASAQTDATGAPRMVSLREIVSVSQGSGPQQINRKEQLREVLITANVFNRPAGDVAAELRAKLERIALPPGYRFTMGGSSKDIQESLYFASQALALAVIFIYLILASQFGSFLQPVAIMMSLPMSLIGVVLALIVARSTMNIFSIIGFIMLMGLVTKNAILLVDFVNQERRKSGAATGAGWRAARREAVLAAGRIRLRPILMTTLAMIFGMIPLALGLGEGGEQRAPMGQAVIGGVMTSGLLTLVVVPVIYTYLDDLATWARGFGKIATPPGRSAKTNPE
ncbi:MAG: efflux RND transporter permease subunit [Burkholderiales bacterium]|nr:efflux RND transporter permease subunit [Burkholderiales bacterium]